jgi:hypothetical protein
MTENIDNNPANAPTPTPSLPTSHSDLEVHYANYTRISTELLAKNREILLDALAAAAITVVVVTFDGGGDEGQIESIVAKNGDDPVEFQDQKIELQHAVMDLLSETKITTLTHIFSFPEAITSLVYDYLGQVQEGWENGEGAYGDFTFDVKVRKVTLDFNERFIDSENSIYEF